MQVFVYLAGAAATLLLFREIQPRMKYDEKRREEDNLSDHSNVKASLEISVKLPVKMSFDNLILF